MQIMTASIDASLKRDFQELLEKYRRVWISMSMGIRGSRNMLRWLNGKPAIVTEQGGHELLTVGGMRY
jgi:hypothetical protein